MSMVKPKLAPLHPYLQFCLCSGDRVFLQLTSEGQGGLINSDWLVTKFSGFLRTDPQTFVTSCQLQTSNDNAVNFANCIEDNASSEQAMVLEEDIWTLNKNGMYKVTLTGDLIIGSTGCESAAIQVEEDVFARFNTAASVHAGLKSKSDAGSNLKVQLPVSTLIYLQKDDTSFKHTLQVTAKAMQDSCELELRNGFFEIVHESSKSIFKCEKFQEANATGILSFDQCSNNVMQADQANEMFTVPQDGIYFIAFTGTLQSLHGSRLWINLNMKDSLSGEGKAVISKYLT